MEKQSHEHIDSSEFLSEEDRKLAEAYVRGASIGDIAKSAGLSYTWMRRRLLQAGVQLRARAKECPVPAKQLAKEYRAGASIRQLAEAYDTPYNKVRDLLLGEHVTLRPRRQANRTHH